MPAITAGPGQHGEARRFGAPAERGQDGGGPHRRIRLGVYPRTAGRLVSIVVELSRFGGCSHVEVVSDPDAHRAGPIGRATYGDDRIPQFCACTERRWVMAKSSRAPRRQFAALPWRHRDKGVEVLLISSRETRRWVIPKGWGKRGEAGPFAAARETLEETGVAGAVASTPLGEYRYGKVMKSGRIRRVRVTVYALEVMFEHDDWPEKSLREKLWTTPADAVRLVAESELRSVILSFAAGSVAANDRDLPAERPRART